MVLLLELRMSWKIKAFSAPIAQQGVDCSTCRLLPPSPIATGGYEIVTGVPIEHADHASVANSHHQ